MKSEAERRLELFLKSPDASDLHATIAATRALLRAIFDPLPPEPEPVKSLGQLLYEASYPNGSWSACSADTARFYESAAKDFTAAVEARRPKPTVESMAKAMFDGTREGHELPWEQISQTRQEFWIRMARAVFPLFGVEP